MLLIGLTHKVEACLLTVTLENYIASRSREVIVSGLERPYLEQCVPFETLQ